MGKALTKEDKAFISGQFDKMPPEEIAKKLGKTVKQVMAYITKTIKPYYEDPENEKAQPPTTLRDSQLWRQLKREFTLEELKYFEEGYNKLMSQFKGDILPTEETQIFQAIKYEILMNRNMKGRKRAIEDMEALEEEQMSFLKRNPDRVSMSDEQKKYILAVTSRIEEAKRMEQSFTNEYVKLQERHDNLMKTLKATRDQRVKQIESSKISFLGLVKMLQERKNQQEESRSMELMKAATDKSYEELGTSHLYDDGVYDLPILSADTVGEDDESQ